MILISGSGFFFSQMFKLFNYLFFLHRFYLYLLSPASVFPSPVSSFPLSIFLFSTVALLSPHLYKCSNASFHLGLKYLLLAWLVRVTSASSGECANATFQIWASRQAYCSRISDSLEFIFVHHLEAAQMLASVHCLVHRQFKSHIRIWAPSQCWYCFFVFVLALFSEDTDTLW